MGAVWFWGVWLTPLGCSEAPITAPGNIRAKDTAPERKLSGADRIIHLGCLPLQR